MTVGFIGLGIMGSRMAANLQQSGHDLVVHNRTAEKADPLVDAGATWADTPAAVAEQVSTLVTMLANPEAVRQTALGNDGFLDRLEDGALWMDCSTVNPSFSREMAREARRRGIRFVDAPAAGTKGPAEQGELLFLAGGEADDVEACRPLLDVMGRKTMHVGEAGRGTALKMLFNMLLATAMLSFAEALALGERQGFSREMLLDTLVGWPVVAPFIEGKRSLIEQDSFDAAFPLKWMNKDLHLAAVTAYEEGVSMPVENLVKELYALATQQGLGDDDFSAITQFLR